MKISEIIVESNGESPKRDSKFDAMMGKITSPDALNTREALAMMLDLIYHQGASYKEALEQVSISYEIDPDKLKDLYHKSISQV
jgi:hypothetical protein